MPYIGQKPADIIATAVDTTTGKFSGVVDADAGITVDNITIDGTEIDLSSGDLTLDVAGDIILDADGGDIKLKDGSTIFGELTNNASADGNFDIKCPVSDADIRFKGNDGGATITALSLDMSSQGSATFNHDIKLPDNGIAYFGAGFDLAISSDGTNGTIAAANGDLTIDVAGSIILDADVTIATGADLITATAGTSNTRVGVNAGDAIQSGGNYNVVIGDEAGTAITTGDENIFIGYASGDATTTASDNTGVGHEALTTNILGSRSVAIGANSLLTQNPASAANMYNTAVGYDSGRAITTGTTNTIVGGFAGDALTTGGSNTAIGYEALTTSEDGGGNNALGYRAGLSITSGARNIAIGEQGMYGLTTANDCIGMGQQSFYATCTGSSNIGLGYRSFFSCTSGSANVGVGHQSLTDLAGGSQNTAIGHRALPHVTSGDNHTGIGIGVGDGASGTALTAGAGTVLIGHKCEANAADTSYAIVIGYSAISKGSSTGFISPNDGAVYQGNNSSSWSTTSDRRIKKNIVDNTVGLDAINQVQVKNFEYRTEDEITEVPSHAAINKQGVQIGVIAQEIQTTLPDMVNEESTGVLSVNPDNMTWYLVNAVQELSAKNDALEARIAELEGN